MSTRIGCALSIEIGNWDTFTGTRIGPLVELLPSEFSGQSRAQGSIAKIGNDDARRLLVEALRAARGILI